MSEQPPFPDPLEFLKNLWAPMGLPLSGVVAPLLSIEEIDKRIADLRSVEQWLTLNQNVLRMTIQGLEMQRTTLAAFQAMQPQARPVSPQKTGTSAAPEPPPASGAEAWWSLLQQVRDASDPTKEKKAK